MTLTPTELYNAAVNAGMSIDHHESDLYMPVNETTKALIMDYEYRLNVSTFTNLIDHTRWYDVPFAYQPWWEARAVSR